MHRLLPLLLLLARPSRSDYILSTFYLASTRCGGPTYQSVAQLVGCVPQGPQSLLLSCTNATAATIAVFSTPNCAGPSTPAELPFNPACVSDQPPQSYSTRCVAGPYGAGRFFFVAPCPPPTLMPIPHTHTTTTTTTAPLLAAPGKGANVASYPGPPNTCPAPRGVPPAHFQDIVTNTCLQSSPTSWIKFGCNSANVTQSTYAAKGCAGAPLASSTAIPLGCTATPVDPSHPDPRAGPRVATCGKKGAEEEVGGAASAAVPPLAPLPLDAARAAAVAALSAALSAALA